MRGVKQAARSRSLNGRAGPRDMQLRRYRVPPEAGPKLLLLVPGPTFPWLDGLAMPLFDLLVLDFMFEPVVMDDEWCVLCLVEDFASAANGEPTNAATASAPIP